MPTPEYVGTTTWRIVGWRVPESPSGQVKVIVEYEGRGDEAAEWYEGMDAGQTCPIPGFRFAVSRNYPSLSKIKSPWAKGRITFTGSGVPDPLGSDPDDPTLIGSTQLPRSDPDGGGGTPGKQEPVETYTDIERSATLTGPGGVKVSVTYLSETVEVSYAATARPGSATYSGKVTLDPEIKDIKPLSPIESVIPVLAKNTDYQVVTTSGFSRTQKDSSGIWQVTEIHYRTIENI